MNLLVRGGTDVHGNACEILIEEGRIVALGRDLERSGSTPHGVRDESTPRLDADGLVVAPGFLDLQVNGVGGIDLTAEPARLAELGPMLVRYGVTGYLPTVITSNAAARADAMDSLARATSRGAVPLGLHFEGPMLASARKGAHAEQYLALPSAELIAEWSADAGVRMVTLAPELPGALEVIASLCDRGVVVSIGHTEATAAQVLAAVAAGARCVTHLFNAMPGVTAREAGPVGVAVDERIIAGVIADGHHLAPETLRFAWGILGPDRFLAVSDATAALGMREGPTRLGDQRVVVAGGAVRLADGTLAGSAASLLDCLQILRTTTGCSLVEAVATATSTPARLLGDDERGRLELGCRGDLALLQVTADGLEVVATVVAGMVVHDVRAA